MLLTIVVIALFAGAMNYFLITEAIKAGMFDFMPSAIVLTVIFPFACLFAGMVVTVNILSKRKK